MTSTGILIGLSAVIVRVMDDQPQIFVIRKGGDDALPFGPFDPDNHDTLELGLRGFIAEQTPIAPGYVEQLYTFGNKGRYAGQKIDGPRVISVGYLALTRGLAAHGKTAPAWGDWYDYFPWEDWRKGKPAIISDVIAPELGRWVESGQDLHIREHRKWRASTAFGLYGMDWDDERVLDRYELLYEARLVEEALRDKNIGATPERVLLPGRAMRFDHRRILATALSRLRGKLKYRPLVFELMPEKFTLFELQKTVEAIAGRGLHKQNFRRLVETAGLVEETGERRDGGRGRPAELYRFRRDVLQERPAPGLRVPGKKNP